MFESIAKYVTSILSGFLASISGFWGWVARAVFGFVKNALVNFAEKLDNKAEAKKEAKEELEKYNEEIKNPNITVEARRIADKSFIGDD